MKSRVYQFLIIVLAGLTACDSQNLNETPTQEQPLVEISTVDLPDIQERGKLKALLNYSSTSYFIYRGQPMGFEYELLKRLAQHLDVDLEVIIAHNLNEATDMLQRGQADIIAQSLTVTKDRKAILDFTDPKLTTRQVLVQRVPGSFPADTGNSARELIRNVMNLEGKEVYVKKSSAYYQRLVNLSDEIGAEIQIKEAPENMQTEDLIRLVAEGEIDYTVADENLAKVQKTYFRNIDIATPVSFSQNLAWAVRKESPLLKEAVNRWLHQIKQQPTFNTLYAKYFKSTKGFNRRADSPFFSKVGSRISEYDALLKQHATTLNWDWRLLASIVYQESRFDPNAESWAGARGLMQVMPSTGKLFGVNDLYNPESNVRAGVAYLEYLQEYWSIIPDSLQRMKFIIASYNAGHGHVQDARRLAEKYGNDPNIWDNQVEEYILKKSQPRYFNDEVVKYGYVRGLEPYTYVRLIVDRYNQYQKVWGDGQGKQLANNAQTAWNQGN